MSNPAHARALDVNIRSGPQMREYEAIVERIVAQRPGRILDFGCGQGQVSHLLRERGLNVESFDYRDGSKPKMVQLERFPDV